MIEGLICVTGGGGEFFFFTGNREYWYGIEADFVYFWSVLMFS